ncbi:mCG1042758 [Mus musculus]|nr:mCG1042758 [Mus musculus]
MLFFVLFFVCLFCFLKGNTLESRSFISFFCTVGHEFILNGLQQLRLFSVSPHEVCFSDWCRLLLQLYPGALLFGFLFLLIILLHMLQKAVFAI